MKIEKCEYNDLPQILDLQKLAYQSEAAIINDYTIQPLTQALEEIQSEFGTHTFLKMTDSEKIIGSVRAVENGNRVNIGKLIIHPDYQNMGYGTKLLAAIEALYEGKSFELFTGSKSERNLYLYKKNGYREMGRKKVSDMLELVFLEK